MFKAFYLPFTIVIILVVYIFILSRKYRDACNYETIVPAVGKQPISFIQLGDYTISGYVNPNPKYPKGLTILGKANINTFHYKGLTMLISYNAFSQDGKKEYSIERRVIFAPNKTNNVFCVRFEYVNNQLKTVQTGAAEKIEPKSLQCSFHSSLTTKEQFHKDIHLYVNVLSDNRYSWKLYNIRRGQQTLIEYMEFRHQ